MNPSTDRVLAFLATSNIPHTLGVIVLQLVIERPEVERALAELILCGYVHRSEGVDGHPPRYHITQAGILFHIQRTRRRPEGEG